MLKELNRVIELIEESLLEPIDLTKLARESGMSEYHLKRTFCYLTGVSLFDYVKYRRLALANAELVTNLSVTDAAFKYGFGSVEGFSRAFKAWTNFTPSEAKQTGKQKSYPPLKFLIDIRGGKSMDFKIEEKTAFNLIGVTKRVPIQFEGENNAVLELAQSITAKQRVQLHELGDLYPQQVLNASFDFDEGRLAEKGQLTHLIGVASSKEIASPDLELIKIPAHTWAVFPNQGSFPQTLQETWANIFAEWLPSSNYELVKAPEISFTKWETDTSQVYSEIWIAVREKQHIL